MPNPGAGTTDHRRPERATNPKTEGFHPDVLAAATAHGVTRLRTLHHFQRVYDQMINASIDGLHAYILTYSDPTGEKATHRALYAKGDRK